MANPADRLRALVPLDLEAISLAAGLRAAVACALPVVIAEWTGRNQLSWIAIVAFWGCLVDGGGAWRARFLSIGCFTLLAALGCALAVACHGSLVAEVALAFVWCFAGSFASLFGNAVTTVGLLLCVCVLVTLGLPGSGVEDALALAGLTLIGGAWAMLLALVLWRLHPYGPARAAVGRAWHALALHAAALGRLHRGVPVAEADWRRVASERRSACRHAIEEARATLVATRRSRAGVSGRSAQLLDLLADAEQVFGASLGVGELLELAGHGARDPAVERAIRLALGRLAQRLERMAAVLNGRAEPPAHDVAGALALARRRIGPAGAPAYHRVLELIDRIAGWVDAAATAMAAARPRRGLAVAIAERPDAAVSPLFGLASRLRANFNIQSVAFRHALRLATTAAIAELVIQSLAITRGYWISLTAIVVLQPYLAATWRRAFERVAGSVLGGLIAAGISLVIQDPFDVALATIPLSIIAMTVKGVNYGLFTLCLTPQFVLIAELFQTGTAGNPDLAGLRALDSALGGLFGLAAGFLLWPAWEAPLFGAKLAEAIRAHRDYLAAVVARVGGVPHVDLAAARRVAGLESNNAEASLQRLIAEPRRRADPAIATGMTILAALRRIAGIAATLALLSERREGDAPEGSLSSLAGWAGSALSAAADALATNTPPGALPDPPGASGAEAAVVAAELDRLIRQIAIIHATAARMTSHAEMGDCAVAAPVSKLTPG